MKPILCFAFFLLILAGCKKESDLSSRSRYMETVQQHLKDSVSGADFASLDFGNARVSGIPKDGLYYLRIPFKQKNADNDFVVVRTTYEGVIVKGKIVHLEGAAEIKHGQPGRAKFKGRLLLSSLDRKKDLSSKITDGFVEAFHPVVLTRLTEPIVPGEAPGMLPEVIVVAYISSSPGISWSTWASLMSFLGDTGGGGNSWNTGYYWPVGGGGGGSSSGGSSGYPPSGGGPIVNPDPLPGGGGIPLDDIFSVDFETQDNLEAIDLQKFINCFNSIPDDGSTCKIEIFSDIPVDGKPNRIFDFNSGSPGHTFLCITKENGLQRASQNIGFYPKTGWKNVLTNAPIDGKFVDNEKHEFNAGFKMNLTPAELTSVLTELLYLKNKKYDIDNYNCTDWALDVFNKVRTNKLEIPLYDIPGNVPSTGTRTPQGLYNKLMEMFNSNHPEKANIKIDIIKGWAGGSTGPCN